MAESAIPSKAPVEHKPREHRKPREPKARSHKSFWSRLRAKSAPPAKKVDAASAGPDIALKPLGVSTEGTEPLGSEPLSAEAPVGEGVDCPVCDNVMPESAGAKPLGSEPLAPKPVGSKVDANGAVNPDVVSHTAGAAPLGTDPTSTLPVSPDAKASDVHASHRHHTHGTHGRHFTHGKHLADITPPHGSHQHHMHGTHDVHLPHLHAHHGTHAHHHKAHDSEAPGENLQCSDAECSKAQCPCSHIKCDCSHANCAYAKGLEPPVPKALDSEVESSNPVDSKLEKFEDVEPPATEGLEPGL